MYIVCHEASNRPILIVSQNEMSKSMCEHQRDMLSHIK